MYYNIVRHTLYYNITSGAQPFSSPRRALLHGPGPRQNLNLSVYVSTYLSIYLSIYLYRETEIYRKRDR